MSGGALLLIASIADVLTTVYGLSLGAGEMNPLVHHFGFPGLLLLKLAITVPMAILLARPMFRRSWLAYVPGGVVIMVVMWNIANLSFFM